MIDSPKIKEWLMHSKSGNALTVCVIFGVGWMFSPWMAIAASILYFKLMRNKTRGWRATPRMDGWAEQRFDVSEYEQIASSSPRQITSHHQPEYNMQYQPTSHKMEPKDYLIIAAVAAYVICPLDLDFIPGLGWIDDAGLIWWTIRYFKNKFNNKDLAPEDMPQRQRNSRPLARQDNYHEHAYDDAVDAEFEMRRPSYQIDTRLMERRRR